jgi:hypothetical protein
MVEVRVVCWVARRGIFAAGEKVDSTATRKVYD